MVAPLHAVPIEVGAPHRPRIAIAHDYLTQRGGAEKVVLALARAFPDAPIHTTLYDPAGTFPEFADLDVRVSVANRMTPLRHRHRAALPVLPVIASSIRIDADVVIMSSSGWAHGFRTSGRTLVYCYSPARWLYQRQAYLGDSRNLLVRATLPALSVPLREWDRRAAARADRYLAISSTVRTRIAQAYGRDAQVVPAPQSIDPTGDRCPVPGVGEQPFHLCVSRLLPYKNVDAVIAAVAATDRRLVVVGAGPQEKALRAAAGPNVLFYKNLSDAQMRWLYSRCRALVAASYEDYGLTPLEACAFGTPSAVLRWGGFLDTLDEGVTGVFFDEPTPEAIRAALDRVDATRWNIAALHAHVEGFTEARFAERMRAQVADLAAAPGSARPVPPGSARTVAPGSARPVSALPLADPPRILFATHSAEPAGAELALLRLLGAMPPETASALLTTDGPVVQMLRDRGVPVRVDARAAAASTLRRDRARPTDFVVAFARLVRSGLRTGEFVRESGHHMVMAQSAKTLVYGFAAARRARVPLIWSVHDRISADYLGRPMALAVRLLGRVLADAYVTNSAATRATLWTGRKPVLEASPGIELSAIERRPARERVRTVAMVGRLTPWKGQELFLRAFARALGHTDITATVVGGPLFGEQAYEQRLHALVHELGIADRVVFTGHVDDVQGYLREAEVMVHCSVVPEPFGLVVIEGLHAGCAVIASAPGGPAEVITDGVDGMLVPCGDETALAVALRRVVDDHPMRRALCEAGPARAEDFDVQTLAPRMLAWAQTLRRS